MRGSKPQLKLIPDIPFLQQRGSQLSSRLIEDSVILKEIVKKLKKIGHKIVLTQGVYDLIHEGHAKYLEMARSYGDVLIVGVDSDDLTRKRKGKGRPIVPQTERLEMLVHLRHVDIVVLRQAHQELGYLIKLVKPDVLVTSFSTRDFTRQMKKDYNDYCKKIVTLPPQSTTTTTARIRNLTIEGAEKLAEEISALTTDFINKIREA